MKIGRLLFASAMVLSQCVAALHAQDDKKLVVVTSGGAFEQQMSKFFYDRFTKETGIKVVPVSANIAEQTTKVRLMSTSNQIEWDLISAQPFDLAGEMSKYLVDLGANCEAVAEAVSLTVDGACKQYGILRSVGGGVLAYDTDDFPAGSQQPESWADFWDVERFPGPRGLPDVGIPWWVLMAALEADGVPSDKLFPLDLDRAFTKLDKIKPHVTLWWKSGDQIQQAFRNKEVSMAMTFSGRAVSLVKEGTPVAYSWNGAPPDVAYWSIVKDSPNQAAAAQFINFFYRDAAALQDFTDGIGYDTAGKNVAPLMSKEQRKRSAVAPENWSKLAQLDAAWISEHREEILQRWADWISQ